MKLIFVLMKLKKLQLNLIRLHIHVNNNPIKVYYSIFQLIQFNKIKYLKMVVML